jgi:prepilin-type N-terminal cleavage/methylation domain-containing protein
MNKIKSLWRTIVACNKGFSLIEASIVLAISGCLLSGVLYQGTRTMQKTRLQKAHKDIMQCALFVDQWKDGADAGDCWDKLSDNGLDAHNYLVWTHMARDGVLNQNAISRTHRVPSFGNGMHVLMVRHNAGIYLIACGLGPDNKPAGVWPQNRANALCQMVRDSGYAVATRSSGGDKYWLFIGPL